MVPQTVIVLLLFFSTANSGRTTDLMNSILPMAETSYQKVATQQIPLLRQPGKPNAYPFDGKPKEDKWRLSNREGWTAGFLAGTFWHFSFLAANAAGAAFWQRRAEIAQQGLLPIQYFNQSHDIGFIMFSSFGNAFLRTGNSNYLPPLNTAAATLGRYNKNVGCTRSWDNKVGAPAERFEVIIDNMMNLELLFWVANYTANATLYNIAVSHATRSNSEHVRHDGSTWQVVAFNSTDGAVIEKYTVQGYDNSSTWARGQAWAVYGFTMAYRYTRNERFLQTAQKTADFFLGNLRSGDMVPYWDFDVPHEKSYQPRDTSAAAIAASGLLELGEYLGEYYRDAGVKILEDLVKYRADGEVEYRIPAILINGTSHYTTGHSDQALIFGDYYFVEGFIRLSRSIHV